MENNMRKKLCLYLALSVVLISAIMAFGFVWKNQALVCDFTSKNLPPSISHLFGTDWMGRDMIYRTFTGLSISIVIGLAAALISGIFATFAGILAGTCGKKTDAAVTFLIDLVSGIPHILLMLLISVAAGRGLGGVILAVSLTHWTQLARVMRAEVLQLKDSGYIKLAKKMGKSSGYIIKEHLLSHILPQFIVGIVLTFPHAILHEASITFLGFGLDSSQPAIGIILSESMKYMIMGKWYLAFFPGLMLVITVAVFWKIGDLTRKLLDPHSLHE